MPDQLEDLRLADYRPTQLDIDCRRCRRHASAPTAVLKARYGNPTLGEVARLVAANGKPPCNLASAIGAAPCSAVPVEPPVHHWATLADALHGGWQASLCCGRRHQGLKATASCPGPEPLAVRSLVAALGLDQRLDRLQGKVQCPGCGTKAVSIEWVVPRLDPPSAPAAGYSRTAKSAATTLHAGSRPDRSRRLRLID